METEIVTDECKHGIPLVNGFGCVICSNRTVADKVYLRLETGTRETSIVKKLRGMASDMVDEVPISKFI